LIDSETGAHVWADRFETDRKNLPLAQAEITARLAERLRLGLLDAADRRIEHEKPVKLQARDLVMRGWAGWAKPGTAEQLEEDQKFFEQALKLDAQSADARIGIATVLIEKIIIRSSVSQQKDVARSEQLLLEALERDQNDPRLHLAMGKLRRLQGQFVE